MTANHTEVCTVSEMCTLFGDIAVLEYKDSVHTHWKQYTHLHTSQWYTSASISVSRETPTIHVYDRTALSYCWSFEMRQCCTEINRNKIVCLGSGNYIWLKERSSSTHCCYYIYLIFINFSHKNANEKRKRPTPSWVRSFFI